MNTDNIFSIQTSILRELDCNLGRLQLCAMYAVVPFIVIFCQHSNNLTLTQTAVMYSDAEHNDKNESILRLQYARLKSSRTLISKILLKVNDLLDTFLVLKAISDRSLRTVQMKNTATEV